MVAATRPWGDLGTLEERLVRVQEAEVTLVTRILTWANVFFQTLLLSVPAAGLTCVKWVIWNPIEYLYQGKITTRSPWNLLMEHLSQILQALKEREGVFRAKVSELLARTEITSAHVDAFLRYANQAGVAAIDIHRVSLDQPASHSSIDVQNLLHLIEGTQAVASCKRFSIPSRLHLLGSSLYRPRPGMPSLAPELSRVEAALSAQGFHRDRLGVAYVR